MACVLVTVLAQFCITAIKFLGVMSAKNAHIMLTMITAQMYVTQIDVTKNNDP